MGRNSSPVVNASSNWVLAAKEFVFPTVIAAKGPSSPVWPAKGALGTELGRGDRMRGAEGGERAGLDELPPASGVTPFDWSNPASVNPSDGGRPVCTPLTSASISFNRVSRVLN